MNELTIELGGIEVKTFSNGVEYERDDLGFYTLYAPDGYYFNASGNHVMGYAGDNYAAARKENDSQILTPCDSDDIDDCNHT